MANTNMNNLLKSLEQSYVKADFETAIDTLLQNRSSFDIVEFHFNLGTLYSKMNNWGASRFHLELSKYKGGFSPELMNNLSFVESKVGELEAEGDIVSRVLDFAISSSDNVSISIALVLILFSLIILRLEWIKKAVCLASILFSFSPFLAHKYIKSNYVSAVSLSDVKVLEGPSKIYEETSTIGAGNKIIIERRKGQWSKIVCPETLIGWINTKKLGIIE